MKARLTAHTEVDLLRGIYWFDRISVGLGEMFEAEFYRALERVKAFTSGEDEINLRNRG